ncbi:hypothetical protein HYR54_04015 [Candidatus Acetothermia bacterium]|nr:hypothetical protein [Candidatus Acetothermia bacterium]
MINIIKLDEGERSKLMNYCRARDVHTGGIFDCRGTESLGAINVWSRPWLDDEACRRSECLGTITFLRDRVEIDSELIPLLAGLLIPLAATLSPEPTGVAV